MKIAITADNHLQRKDEHPERWHTVQDIVKQIEELGIDTLIIAGDLFDKDYDNYSEIDSIIENSKLKECFIIPRCRECSQTMKKLRTAGLSL